jgi:hypothetical protein
LIEAKLMDEGVYLHVSDENATDVLVVDLR